MMLAAHARMRQIQKFPNRWNGSDIRKPAHREFEWRMSNPKFHWKHAFAGDPMIPTFAEVPAEKGYEC
jgi:hypothetical protein